MSEKGARPEQSDHVSLHFPIVRSGVRLIVLGSPTTEDVELMIEVLTVLKRATVPAAPPPVIPEWIPNEWRPHNG